MPGSVSSLTTLLCGQPKNISSPLGYEQEEKALSQMSSNIDMLPKQDEDGLSDVTSDGIASKQLELTIC